MKQWLKFPLHQLFNAPRGTTALFGGPLSAVTATRGKGSDLVLGYFPGVEGGAPGSKPSAISEVFAETYRF